MSGVNGVSFHPGAYPLLRIALLYATGIVIGRILASSVFGGMIPFTDTGELPAGDAVQLHDGITELLLFTMATGVIFCLLVPVLKSRDSAVYLALRLYGVPVVYLVCIAGFGVLQSFRQHATHTPDELVLQHFEPDMLLFFGGVISERTTRSGNLMLVVDIDSVQIRDLPVWLIPFRTEILIRSEQLEAFGSRRKTVSGTEAGSASGSAPGSGSYLYFSGDLQPPPRPRNPNQFDYAAFLSRRDIHCQIFVTEITGFQTFAKQSFWLGQQVRMRRALGHLFSNDNTGLARAIILGDRSDLDPDLRTAFSRAGLAHLMAVSGMHVGFILLPVWFILPWFRRSAALRYAGLALGASLLLFYAGITGFSVSVSRASLMAFFMMLARLFHKPGTSMNILGAAAFILLLNDPLMLFDVGFQLSFLAVIIILTTLPGTRYLLPPKHRYRKTGALFQFVMVSVLVQGGLYPLLIHYFQEFSIAGPVSNTLAVPFVQFMFLWSFFSLGVSMFHPSSSVLLNTPGDLILSGLTTYVTWIGAHPASWIEQTLPGPWIFGVWFFGIAFLAGIRIPSVRFKMAIGLLLCLILLQTNRITGQFRTPELQVTFFDVGQGDAVLLQTPGGFHYLYDTGVWSPGFDSAERTILPELKAMGIRRLDGVVLSHPHADHIGGIVSLMHHIPVDTIYQSPASYDSRLYDRYMSLAREMNIPVRLMKIGDMITTDPSMPMLVLAPSSEIRPSDPNNQSVVVMAVYGQTRLLLTGDAEKEAEDFMVERFGPFLKSDLLKVGHHASRTSSTLPFVQVVGAPKAVASLGLSNRYQHPHSEATGRLQNAGTSIRFTSLEGAIIYRSDGNSFSYVPWQPAKVR